MREAAPPSPPLLGLSCATAVTATSKTLSVSATTCQQNHTMLCPHKLTKLEEVVLCTNDVCTRSHSAQYELT